MKNGFVLLIILLVFLVGAVSLGVMSDNISNTIKLIPDESEYTANSDYRININTAKTEDLTLLPGIGEELAKRIVEYRDKHGKYNSLEDLLNVKGVGYSTLNKICKMITVGG